MTTGANGRPWLFPVEGGVELEVLAVPRASRSRVLGVHDGRLKVQLAAPPADGEANAALLALLAARLGLRRGAAVLVCGHGQRRKRVRLLGVEVRDALALVAP